MRRFIFILVSFFALSADLVDMSFFYQQKDDTGAKIKAVFLYNFTRYFEWPANSGGNFTITVVGENQGIFNELTKMSTTKMVGTQKLLVKKVGSLKEVENTQILYLLSDKNNLLSDAISKTKGKGTLLVTEKPGAAKDGSAINFIVQENKHEFELNKKSAEKNGLKVSSSLQTLAKTSY